MIRAAIRPGADIWDADDIVRPVFSNAEFQKFIGGRQSSSEPNYYANLQEYARHMVRHIVPAHYFEQYQTQRYGARTTVNASPETRMIDILPAQFQAAYLSKGMKPQPLSEAEGSMLLAKTQHSQLRNLIQTNSAAMRAAEASRIVKQDKNGQMQMTSNVTRQQFEDFLQSMWGDYVNRASGRQSSRIDFYDQNLSTDQMGHLVGRASAGSAGRVLSA